MKPRRWLKNGRDLLGEPPTISPGAVHKDGGAERSAPPKGAAGDALLALLPQRFARLGGGAGVLVVLLASGCTDAVPTSGEPALIPISAQTFEVILPFEAFGRDFRVDGGYGSTSSLSPNRIVLAEDGGLEVRTLLRFAPAPPVIQVVPPGGSATVPDSAAVPVGGRVTLQLDTTRFQGEPPFELLAAAVTEAWDPPTASWVQAIDTLGGRQSWTDPGGGAVRPIATFEWNPIAGDSLTFEVDSVTATAWASGDDVTRGLRLSSTSAGANIRILSAEAELDLRSSIDPDTTVRTASAVQASTMLLDPQADASDGRMLVGGAPAFRSTFRLELPDSVTATGPVCAGAGSCQVALTGARIVFAGLTLRSIPAEPGSLAPADSLVMDLRPVLAPERLPRSPLGTPVLPQGRRLAPALFAPGGEAEVEIGATRLVRDLADHDDDDPEPVPSTISLLGVTEPTGIGVASFGGPGSARSPFLRLILTASEGVTLP